MNMARRVHERLQIDPREYVHRSDRRKHSSGIILLATVGEAVRMYCASSGLPTAVSLVTLLLGLGDAPTAKSCYWIYLETETTTCSHPCHTGAVARE